MIDWMARRLDRWVLRWHQCVDVSYDETPVPWCRLCRCPWPCDTVIDIINRLPSGKET